MLYLVMIKLFGLNLFMFIVGILVPRVHYCSYIRPGAQAEVEGLSKEEESLSE